MKVTDHLRGIDIRTTRPGLMDRLYARMVDGRTIQQHLELVAPVLESRGSAVAVGPDFPWHSTGLLLESRGLDYLARLVRAVPLRSGSRVLTSSPTAAGSIRDLAKVFFLRWAEVESELLSIRLGDVPAVEEVSDIFAGSVLHEFLRRSGEPPADPGPSRDADLILGLMDRLAPIRLSQELCAYWYPGWSRSLFIFDSPFDYLGGADDLGRFLKEHQCST